MLIDKPRILVVRLGSKLAQVDYIIYLCNMTKQEFILNLRKDVNDFAPLVSTKDGQWVVKGCIDV